MMNETVIDPFSSCTIYFFTEKLKTVSDYCVRKFYHSDGRLIDNSVKICDWYGLREISDEQFLDVSGENRLQSVCGKVDTFWSKGADKERSEVDFALRQPIFFSLDSGRDIFLMLTFFSADSVQLVLHFILSQPWRAGLIFLFFLPFFLSFSVLF